MNKRLRRVRSPRDLQIAYESGFEGAIYSPQEEEKLRDIVNWEVGLDAALEFGWQDESKGKLVIPYKNIEMLWPTSMPGPAQRRGDPGQGI